MNEIISFSPTTLPELIQSIEQVSEGKAFFGSDLALYSQKVETFTDAIISKMMEVYFKTLDQTENRESLQVDLNRFRKAFSSYAGTLDTVNSKYLANSVNELLKANELLVGEKKMMCYLFS